MVISTGRIRRLRSLRVCAVIAGALNLMVSGTAWPYQPLTHQTITELAADASALRSSPSVLDILQCSGTNSCTSVYGSAGIQSDVRTILGLAAFNEDDGKRPFAHFLNPQNPQILPYGAPLELRLTLFGQPVCNSALVFFPSGVGCTGPGGNTTAMPANSVTWSLSDEWQNTGVFASARTPPDCNSLYDCSYGNAKAAYLTAVTASTPLLRNTATTTLFQNLGHILHHIEDLAQPQHVRNDPHCDALECQLASFAGASGFGEASDYEEYVNEIVASNTTLFARPQGALATLPTPAFTTPADFWVSADGRKRGIAEYASENFLSVGTGPTLVQSGANFLSVPAVGVPLPNQSPAPLMSQQLSCTANPPSLGAELYLTGSIFDNEHAGPTPANALIGVLGLGQFVGGNLQWPVTQNCATYNQAMYLLLPQAIRYSAWFIDFLFRGSMSATLDSSGNLVVTNTTPTSEAMNGAFTLFTDDNNGNRSAVGACSLNIAANSSSSGQTCQLTLGAPPPSGNDLSGKYLLVFNGTLGVEANQVAVATVAAATLRGTATYNFVGTVSVSNYYLVRGYPVTGSFTVNLAASPGSASFSSSSGGGPPPYYELEFTGGAWPFVNNYDSGQPYPSCSGTSPYLSMTVTVVGTGISYSTTWNPGPWGCGSIASYVQGAGFQASETQFFNCTTAGGSIVIGSCTDPASAIEFDASGCPPLSNGLPDFQCLLSSGGGGRFGTTDFDTINFVFTSITMTASP